MHIRSLALFSDHHARELRVEGLGSGLTAFCGPRDEARAELAELIRDGLLLDDSSTLCGTLQIEHAGARQDIVLGSGARRQAGGAARNALNSIPSATRRRFYVQLADNQGVSAQIADWLSATPREASQLRTPEDEPLAVLLRRRDQIAEQLDELAAADRYHGPLDWEPRQIDARLESCRQELRRCDEEHARAAAELTAIQRTHAPHAPGGEPTRGQLAERERGDLDALDQQIAQWRQALHAGDRREEALRERRNEYADGRERTAAELDSLARCQRAMRTHVDQLLRLRRQFLGQVGVALPGGVESQEQRQQRCDELIRRLERLEAARRALRGEIEDWSAQRGDLADWPETNESVEVRARLREVEAGIHAALHARRANGIAMAMRSGAGAYLSNFSGGRLTDVVLPAGRAPRVVDAHSNDVPLVSLSTSSVRQAALAAAMAHAATCNRQGVELPLVLEEPFAGQDEESTQRIADVLCEYAALGRQVLIFMGHSAAAGQLRKRGADVREPRCEVAEIRAPRRKTAAAKPQTLRVHSPTRPNQARAA